jgi:hypothetical protein
MNAPDEPRQDDAALDAAWRAARAGTAPSPAVRTAILAEAASAALAARAAQAARTAAAAPDAHGGQRFDPALPAANDARWKLRAAAAIAVLGLVGLIAQQALRQQHAPPAAPVPPPSRVAEPAMRAETAAPAPASPVAGAADMQPSSAAPIAAVPKAAAPGASMPTAAAPTSGAEPAPAELARGATAYAERASGVSADAAAPAPPQAPTQTARMMAKAAAPAETDTWAQDTEMLINELLARRGIAPGAVTVSCQSDRCELAGAADAVRALVRAPELAGRLRLAAGSPVAGRIESDAQSGTVRYTLERVPGS